MIHNSSVGITRLNMSKVEYDLQTLFTPQQETEHYSCQRNSYYWIERCV